GIPDFRGPQGVWTRNPEAARLFTLQNYLADREIRRRAWIARRDSPAWAAVPNAAHNALVELDRAGRLAAVVTQNIDGLHQRAGLPDERVIELHGTLFGVVCLGCGDRTEMAAALDRVAAGASGPPPEVVPLDVADLASVRAAADRVAETVDRLDVLMNNAGVMALPFGRTADGFEIQFGTNHLGPFALSGLLLPALRRADDPRVVTVSSLLHRGGVIAWNDLNWEHAPYRTWAAYSQSKLANLLFTFELDRRVRAAGVELIAAAAHPGYARTHLQTAGAEQSGNRAKAAAITAINRVLGQSDAMGALPQLYAATMPDVEGGDYFGPRGPFEQRGHPKRVSASAAARDVDAARRLWVASETLTGVSFNLPPAPPPSS
ncbi:MAG: oxidoreductase, partial [Acidimicrobiales bacterium]